jgi:hypothetical protein
MSQLITIIISAFSGAAAVLICRELIAWYRRPRLVVDFERTKNEYPLTQNYNDAIMGGNGTSFRIIFLHLNVINKGKTTAYDCEAKMDLIATKSNNKSRAPLHWSKLSPAMYKSIEQLYTPINLNRNDNEIIDVLRLQYINLDSDPLHIETYSPSGFWLSSNQDYYVKVTVYARNTTSQPFCFKVNWDGTIQGFSKAFTKIRSIPMLHPDDSPSYIKV